MYFGVFGVAFVGVDDWSHRMIDVTQSHPSHTVARTHTHTSTHTHKHTHTHTHTHTSHAVTFKSHDDRGQKNELSLFNFISNANKTTLVGDSFFPRSSISFVALGCRVTLYHCVSLCITLHHVVIQSPCDRSFASHATRQGLVCFDGSIIGGRVKGWSESKKGDKKTLGAY